MAEPSKIVAIRGHKPPEHLSDEARALWIQVLADYEVDKGAGLALLRQALEALDGVRACQRQIAADGLMVTGSRRQKRPHPLLRVEADYRRQMLSCFRALNLELAPE